MNATSCGGFQPEDSGMYPVLFCLIFAFHPKLNLGRIVILRSFSHTLEQLNYVSYLNIAMLENINTITSWQLQVWNFRNVFCRVKIFIWSFKEMVSKKYKSRFLEIEIFSKQEYTEKFWLTGQLQNALFVIFFWVSALILDRNLKKQIKGQVYKKYLWTRYF